jgi:hypothetical protein
VVFKKNRTDRFSAFHNIFHFTKFYRTRYFIFANSVLTKNLEMGYSLFFRNFYLIFFKF